MLNADARVGTGLSFGDAWGVGEAVAMRDRLRNRRDLIVGMSGGFG